MSDREELFERLERASINSATALTAKDKEIEALRERVKAVTQSRDTYAKWGTEAMARAETAERERDEARAALKPFAKGWWSHQDPGTTISVVMNHNPYDERNLCKVRDVHAARAVIKQGE